MLILSLNLHRIALNLEPNPSEDEKHCNKLYMGVILFINVATPSQLSSSVLM